MYIYQINMPYYVETILDDPTFMWMLSPQFCSRERYKQLECFELNGYQFDAAIFDFLLGQITVVMEYYDAAAIEELLCNFSVGSWKSLSFPTVKNKKSFAF